MEIKAFIQVLLRRWWLLLLPPLVAAALLLPGMLDAPAAAGGYTTSFQYSAAQQFNLPDRDGDYQDVWLASEFVVNAFTDWVRSSSFRAEIARQLGDPQMDLTQLGIAADNRRSIGLIQMSHPDGAALQQIAGAAAAVLQSRNHEYFPHLGGEPAQVTLLDAPVVVPAPPPLVDRFAPFVRVGLALLGGIALAFLAEYLDPTVRSRRQVEMAGIRMVGAIPPYRSQARRTRR